MTPEEKKIEAAANNYMKRSVNNMGIEKTAFITGAKSDAAKEYHNRGMFTLSDFLSFGEYCFNNETNQSEFGIVMREWFNENKKK